MQQIKKVSTSSDEIIGVEADVSNMETSISASPTPTLRIHKVHPKSQIIGPVDTPIQTRHKSKIVEEQSFMATIHQKTDPALLQFYLYSCFLSQVEPKKVSDALQDPSWVEAIQEELIQFKIQKEEGIDYDEVFAPVARIEAIRLFLAYASFMGFTVYQMDVKSAFLYGTIDEEVYVMQPPGFHNPMYPTKVYKVEKAMYGLHQAPRSCKPYEESISQVPEGSGNPNPIISAFIPLTDQMETLTVESPIPSVSSPVPTACVNDSSEPSSKVRLVSKRVANQEETPSLDNILSL
nr:hypothetical protein [Tanacetum cinerariifolium]